MFAKMAVRTWGALAAVVVLAAGKGADDKVILGSGDYTFEWVKGWAKLPEGVKYEKTHGCVAVDSKGRVYMNSDSDHAVLIWDADGKFVKSWDKGFKGGTHGMTIVKEGDQEVMYLAHLGRHEVVKTTLDGDVLLALPFPDKAGVYTDKNQYRPTAIGVAPNGDVYAADGYGRHWIHQYNAKGEYLKSWGAAPAEPWKLNNPHGIYVDTRKDPPVVVVADRGNSRLLMFSLDAKFLGVVTEELRLPCHTHAGPAGELVVPDLNGRVTILDKNNKLILHLGENSDPAKRGKYNIPPAQWKDGEFISPHCAAWDAEGNLYVQDWNETGRITKLKRIKK